MNRPAFGVGPWDTADRVKLMTDEQNSDHERQFRRRDGTVIDVLLSARRQRLREHDHAV
jgi:hypothetical protein